MNKAKPIWTCAQCPMLFFYTWDLKDFQSIIFLNKLSHDVNFLVKEENHPNSDPICGFCVYYGLKIVIQTLAKKKNNNNNNNSLLLILYYYLVYKF